MSPALMVVLAAFVQLLEALVVQTRASEPFTRSPAVIAGSVSGAPVAPSIFVTLRLLAVQPMVKR
jgi:hypothetical protein